MPWQIPWPEFLKKRLCRYLLQHYLGHFFKEKISLEQLSIDIYNGTGCVKNLHLDCDALNEQINSSSSTPSSVPIEIVSGFVGYISVYIPWHDLFNDYCKLTIKNVQVTIRTKQRKQQQNQSNFNFAKSSSTRKTSENEDDFGSMFSDDSDSNSNSMFSSMFIDSIMNTSMHIAQECLNEESLESLVNNEKNISNKSVLDSDPSIKSNSLVGLEAFASIIDSILSRIKINLEQIQIRIENIENEKQAGDLMSSSSIFQHRPSNGIALELRIKSIKYFDVDSATPQTNQTSPQNSLDPSLHSQTTSMLRNTTKSFNIEGLTVYFDEFIMRDDFDSQGSFENKAKKMSESTSTQDETETNSLNSTIDLNDANSTISEESNTTVNNTTTPIDECPPFNFELNPDYYLYTNPIIMLTFTGMQSIKLTINNLRPTDMIIEAASSGQDLNTKLNQQIKDQQRPFLEVNAQFGSIKCLLCPKQIHLLTEMVNKLNDYIEQANNAKKALKLIQQKRKTLNKSKKSNKILNKAVRGCDKRKFESLLQNDLIFNPNAEFIEGKF